MIWVYVILGFVTVLSLWTAWAVYQNTKTIGTIVKDYGESISLNSKHICQILELIKEEK